MFKKKCSGSDIVFVIPTKNRPKKMDDFLNSVVKQSIKPNRIIIVASGDPIIDVIDKYRTNSNNKLNIDYYEAIEGGQIAQRNQGIAQIGEQESFVAFFDDDIVLEENALENMINFINTASDDIAGVSFNIVNMSRHCSNVITRSLGISGSLPGRILKSGSNTAIANVLENIQTDWLCGGATIWRKEIIKNFQQRKFNTRWASCEDLIFSYPIGKHHKLFVCADAKVRHEHVYDHTGKKDFSFYGKTETLWRMYFVSSHKELSLLRFYFANLSLLFARIIIGIAKFEKKHFQFAIGQFRALMLGPFILMGKYSWQKVLSE